MNYIQKADISDTPVIFNNFFLCLTVFVIVSYFKVMNEIQPIVDDWNNQKQHLLFHLRSYK